MTTSGLKTNGKGNRAAEPAWIVATALLALPLLVVAWTVDSALWVRGLPSLMWHVAPAVMVSYLGQTRARSVPLLLATVAITTVAWVIIATWLRTGPRLPEMGLFLVATVWLMGIATMLLAHRGRRSFAAFMPGLVAMLIVLAFLPSSFAWRLAAFLVAAAPAAGFLRAQRHADVGPPRVTTRTILAALAFAAVATGVASVAPIPDAAFRPGLVSDAGDLWYDLIENAPGLFKDVPSRQEWPRIRINDTLGFTGPVASSATEVIGRLRRRTTPMASRYLRDIYNARLDQWRYRSRTRLGQYARLRERGEPAGIHHQRQDPLDDGPHRHGRHAHQLDHRERGGGVRDRSPKR
jgi:hypothetical protein